MTMSAHSLYAYDTYPKYSPGPSTSHHIREGYLVKDSWSNPHYDPED